MFPPFDFICVRKPTLHSPTQFGYNIVYLTFTFGYGHTWHKVPDPIRTRKSNYHGRRQYCGGGPRGNTACRNLFFFFFPLFPRFLYRLYLLCTSYFFSVSPLLRASFLHTLNRLRKKLSSCCQDSELACKWASHQLGKELAYAMLKRPWCTRSFNPFATDCQAAQRCQLAPSDGGAYEGVRNCE